MNQKPFNHMHTGRLLLLSITFLFQSINPAISQRIFFPNAADHTGNLTDISADPSGAFIATAADDNTIRIYNQQNGDNIKTLFLPFNNYSQKQEYNTRIHAMAFYHDGKTLACAGKIGNIIQNDYAVYFFDRD